VWDRGSQRLTQGIDLNGVAKGGTCAVHADQTHIFRAIASHSKCSAHQGGLRGAIGGGKSTTAAVLVECRA
jgi:hypothetical protein